MNRFTWCGVAVLSLFSCAGRGPACASPRANLIAVVTDDQGRWAMGAYGNKEIHTPSMDRIAREGALFENAFVATPVCSPSRATYLTGLYETECGITDWISPQEAAGEQPFAVLLHYRAPHTPYSPVPEEDSAHYAELDPTVPSFPGADVEQLKTKTRQYYASVSSVDRNLGRLLESLDRLGLAQNTLVVFTSDHGYNLGRHGISTKGNGTWMAGGVSGPARPNMWDTSVRTPMAVRWPAVVKPGTKIDHMVSHLDMFRFVLGALEIPVPEGCKAHGVDFSPLLRGGRLPPRGAIFGQYDLHNNSLAYLRMIRTPRWKFVRHFHSESLNELYDLQTDPEEKRNRLRRGEPREEDRETYRQLHKQLGDWMESIDDPLLDDPY